MIYRFIKRISFPESGGQNYFILVEEEKISQNSFRNVATLITDNRVKEVIKANPARLC